LLSLSLTAKEFPWLWNCRVGLPSCCSGFFRILFTNQQAHRPYYRCHFDQRNRF
jgi:hypothetical protein